MSVANGKAKLTAQAASMAQGFQEFKSTAEARYTRGLADAGVTVGPQTRAKYARRVAAAEWHAPDPVKWERNYLVAMAR